MSEEERKACQECGKAPATVLLTEFIDGRPVKIDLCEKCYGKKAGLRLATGVEARGKRQ
jgi:protein-arginine kinase activator protein McsA